MHAIAVTGPHIPSDTALSRYVRERYFELNDREPTARGMSRESGYLFSHTTAARVLNGSHGMVDETTIGALAELLRVEPNTLRALVDVSSHGLPAFVLPERANRLDERQRRAVLMMIDTLLASSGGKGAAAATRPRTRQTPAAGGRGGSRS